MVNDSEGTLDDSFEYASMKPEFTLELFEDNLLKVNVFVSEPTLEIVEFKDTQIKTKSNKYVYKCKLFGYVGNKNDDNSFYVTFELMLDQPGLSYSYSAEPLLIENKQTGYHTITFTTQK